jgi:hypothetical protein
VVDPSLPRLSHPAVDSEQEEAERGGVMGDGRRRSDDEDDEGMDVDDGDDDGLAELSDDADDEVDPEVYRGGKYRAFHVSQHSLVVRAIARHPEGLKEDNTTADAQRQPPPQAHPPQMSPQQKLSSRPPASEEGKAKVSSNKGDPSTPITLGDEDDDFF